MSYEKDRPLDLIFLSIPQAAEIAGISKKNLYTRIARGTLPRYGHPRNFRIKLSDILPLNAPSRPQPQVFLAIRQRAENRRRKSESAAALATAKLSSIQAPLAAPENPNPAVKPEPAGATSGPSPATTPTSVMCG